MDSPVVSTGTTPLYSPRICLLATDLDGTLLGLTPEFNRYNEFRDEICARQTAGCIWVISTGRRLRDFQRIFLPLRTFGIVPDFIVIRHAYIFERKEWGWYPHILWNLKILELQVRNRFHARRVIPHLRRLIARNIPFVRVPRQNSQRICFRFNDLDSAAQGDAILSEAVRPYRYLRVFRYRNEVDVYRVPFTKGLSLMELARKVGIAPANILAIGDGHNDISMMDPDIAQYCACPANAAPEVIETVNKNGGHIARQPHLAGVLEILQAFKNNAIDPRLPDNWIPPPELDNPRQARPHREGHSGTGWISFGLFLLSVYLTWAVFAYYGLAPMRQTILKPLLFIFHGLRQTLIYLGLSD
jgi:hydroxymethylpyrimidine pyrophosphatase-like HAD family hydrolase